MELAEEENKEELVESVFAEEDLAPVSLEDATYEPERMIPAIEFRDVHLSFDDQKILNGVSFTVRKGETKIVLGRSTTSAVVISSIVVIIFDFFLSRAIMSVFDTKPI